MDPPPPPGKQPAMLPGFGPPRSTLFQPRASEVHSRASDAGSDGVSGGSAAGSTATMDTSISASTHHTEVSAASTVFNPPHVHFFNLDDFAGHEIHAILEDGEKRQEEEEDAQEAGSQKESVRPGSGDSNIEQRLGDMTDFIDDQSAPPEFDGAPAHFRGAGLATPAPHHGAGSSSAHAMAPSAGTPEQMRMALLEQMQYRELSSADIQLLLQLEAELESLRRQAAPAPPPAALAAAGSSSGPTTDLGPSAPS